MDGDTYNVSSNGQWGGITAGQVNFGPQHRVLDDMRKRTIDEALLPYQGKQIGLAIQDMAFDAKEFGEQVRAYLTSKGWDVLVSYETLFGGGAHDFIIQPNGDSAQLVVSAP